MALSLRALTSCDDDPDATGEPLITSCDGGEQLLNSQGEASGYIRCPDGSVNRAAAVPCESGDDWCHTDEDCDPGWLCMCPGIIPDGTLTRSVDESPWFETSPGCVPAGCRDNSECFTGECGIGQSIGGCSDSWPSFDCRRGVKDECRGDWNCGEDRVCQTYKFSAADISWECSDLVGGCEGRPLTTSSGELRVASSAASDAWIDRDDPGVKLAALSDDARARLARHWHNAGLLEHASIASFARFIIELQRLGAPAELVQRARRAMADEVSHARRCFTLASRYAGRPLGPGPLSLAGVDHARSRDAIVRDLIRGACLEETLGVAEASWALAACTDPGVAALLDVLIADETRHAALAWSALAWILGEARPVQREAIARELSAAFAGVASTRERPDPARVPSGLGVLSASERAAARTEACETVLAPLVAAISELTGSTSGFQRSADSSQRG